MVRRRRVSPFPPPGGRPPAVLKFKIPSCTGRKYFFQQDVLVKAGGMRVSKKQEYGPVEKTAKPPGREKTSAIASFSRTQNMGVLLSEVLSKMSHKIHAAALQVTHQKPQPALEKFTLPKRIYIIQQPRKC